MNPSSSTDPYTTLVVRELPTPAPSESDSLFTLRKENDFLRAQNTALNDRVASLSADWAAPTDGETIPTRARMLAFQRICRQLQEELERSERNAGMHRQHAAQLEEELHTSQSRCALLSKRLDETSDAAEAGDDGDPTSYHSLARRLKARGAELEAVRGRLEELHADYERRGATIAALHRENAALRTSVSLLVEQVERSSHSLLAKTMGAEEEEEEEEEEEDEEEGWQELEEEIGEKCDMEWHTVEIEEENGEKRVRQNPSSRPS